ncbi:MAG: EFR1 family ferrodoxin [Syntrophales bacterium]|nr:EFR1 family ferrodoxin [Syntrophales bacterium]
MTASMGAMMDAKINREAHIFCRRGFLMSSLALALSLAAPGSVSASVVKAKGALKNKKPQKGCVLSYSQTGYTERYGKLIARCWEKQGLTVMTGNLKQADRSALANYDLIAIGAPVHYFDVPKNVQDWLTEIPSINGIGVVSYVSFGGNGNGQHNAAVNILEALTNRGGIPLGMDTFGNMSAYPPTWSMGNEAQTLKFRDKPDQATYARVRALASDVLGRYASGQGITVQSEPSFSGLFKGGISRWVAKATIGRHEMDTKLCIRCGTCVNRCPVGAIDLAIPRIDTKRCILCFGCLNNCPTGAHVMTTFGKKIYSFAELLKRHKIAIQEPRPIDG